MATLSELTIYRDALWAALGGGVRRVRDSNGEEVLFGSLSEIKEAIAAVEHQIRLVAAPGRPAIVYPSASKGL